MKPLGDNQFCAPADRKFPAVPGAVSRGVFTTCAGGGSLLEAVPSAAAYLSPGDVTLPACLNLNHFRSQPSRDEVYSGAAGRACGQGLKAASRKKTERTDRKFARGFYEEKPRREQPKLKLNLKKGANQRLTK